jgi:hypothetical protein
LSGNVRLDDFTGALIIANWRLWRDFAYPKRRRRPIEDISSMRGNHADSTFDIA